MSEAFLKALQIHERKTFTCPESGLSIELRPPAHMDLVRADVAYESAISERNANALTLERIYDEQWIQLLAVVAYVRGEAEPIGRANLGYLTESSIAFYIDQLKQLQGEASPDMNASEIEAAIREVYDGDEPEKKTMSDELLSSYEPGKLRALVRTMAVRQSS